MNKLLLCILLVGCGSMKALVIEREFEPYYKDFKHVYGMSPNISITMVPKSHFDKPLIVGHCNGKTRAIHINKEYWFRSTTTDTNRWELVMHELGHCLFKRGHNDNLFPDNCPVSIMHSKILISDYCFKKYKEHYYAELP